LVAPPPSGYFQITWNSLLYLSPHLLSMASRLKISTSNSTGAYNSEYPHHSNSGPLGNGTGGISSSPTRSFNGASKVGAWNSGAPGMGGAGNHHFAKNRRMSLGATTTQPTAQQVLSNEQGVSTKIRNTFGFNKPKVSPPSSP